MPRMTFAQYWEANEPFGSDPEEVAKLAWNAAIATFEGREDREPECRCYCVGDQADASDCPLHRG